MEISVDEYRCLASGLCTKTVERVFGQSPEDGVVELRTERPPPETHAGVREAAALCPGRAIIILE